MNERDIFIRALQIEDTTKQEEFLIEVCGTDEALRERVRTLLQSHARAESYLESPAVDFGATVALPPISEKPGDTIGPYKLLQQIGEGGMGVVYMAEQKEPVRRKVALKIIKPGMDTRQVVARFEAERQALAMMDHPNIARVLDGGSTDSGRPYFVMELVKGTPITQYCDEQRLTTRERLDLFISVCQAVQHAHQKGIIHRDLKPTNVMVAQYDDQPVPKVIDFGVAKATNQQLTEKTMFTELGQIIGTIEYMSPEQAQVNQLDIDTRSDVYSLGVLLYELLTGETPFDKKRLRSAAFEEMLQIIREEEPPKPSTRLSSSEALPTISVNRSVEPAKLSATIRGDLDWIVMRALEKDRTRRYETATNFAADIERYLEDEPVEACPPSAAYKFRKFARRNKALLSTGAIVAAALILGAIGTTWQSIRATHAEKEATTERDRAVDAEQLAQTRLENEKNERTRAEKAEQLAKAESEKVKTEAAIAKAVSNFLQNDLLSQADPKNEPDRDIKLRTVLDRAAKRIDGKFKDQPLVEAALRNTISKTYNSLGNYKEAERHSKRAVELAQHELGPEDKLTLEYLVQLSAAISQQARYAEAENILRPLLGSRRRILGVEHPDTLHSMSDLSSILQQQGRFSESEEMGQQILEIRERVLGAKHPDTLISLDNLAVAFHNQGKYVKAEEIYLKSLSRWPHILGDEHPHVLWVMSHLGTVLDNQDRYTEAEVLHRKTLEIRKRILGEKHPDTLVSMSRLASNINIQGHHAEAEKIYRQTLEILKIVLGDEHPKTFGCQISLADAIIDQGRRFEAEEIYIQALETSKRMLGEEHPNTTMAMNRLAIAIYEQDRFAEAEKLYRQTLEIQIRALGNEFPETLRSMNNLAVVINAQGRYAEAEELHRKTLDIRKRVLGNDHSETLSSMMNVAIAANAQGRHADSEKLLRSTLESCKHRLGIENPTTLACMDGLADAIRGQSRYTDAEALFREILEIRKRVLGSEHPSSIKSMNNLARAIAANPKVNIK